MTLRKPTYAHRPLRPGEDPAAEDLGRAELMNDSGMQNTVAVVGLGALIIIPAAWLLARLTEWRKARHLRRSP